jgi:hypothetical protein
MTSRANPLPHGDQLTPLHPKTLGCAVTSIVFFLSQAFSTTYTLANFLGYLGMYSTLMVVACVQLEKLHQRLRAYRRDGVTQPDTEEEYLREQIQFHQSILR